jgi:hypothetical protein
MKIQKHITVLVLSLSILCSIATAENKAGPNGGRLITKVTPQAEFFVSSDHYAQITFIDIDGKPIAPQAQVVSLMGGDRSKPITISFESIDGVLRSTEPLPEQSSMPIILSIKPSPEAKTVREKFYLNQSICGGCNYEEYACTCSH